MDQPLPFGCLAVFGEKTMNQWLNKMERKFGRYAIPDLMLYVSVSMVAVYVFDIMPTGFHLGSKLALIPSAILRGEVWRLITFIALPPASGVLTMFISIYFYFYLGRTLEYNWGSFKFNAYYLCGMVGCIIAAFLSGYGTNTYLNLSLFLAFAALYPEQEVLLFFVLPIKVKYIAYVDWLVFGLAILFGTNQVRFAAIFSLINYFLFFGPDQVIQIKNHLKHRKMRQNFKNQNQNNPWNNSRW